MRKFRIYTTRLLVYGISMNIMKTYYILQEILGGQISTLARIQKKSYE